MCADKKPGQITFRGIAEKIEIQWFNFKSQQIQV